MCSLSERGAEHLLIVLCGCQPWIGGVAVVLECAADDCIKLRALHAHGSQTRWQVQAGIHISNRVGDIASAAETEAVDLPTQPDGKVILVGTVGDGVGMVRYITSALPPTDAITGKDGYTPADRFRPLPT